MASWCARRPLSIYQIAVAVERLGQVARSDEDAIPAILAIFEPDGERAVGVRRHPACVTIAEVVSGGRGVRRQQGTRHRDDHARGSLGHVWLDARGAANYPTDKEKRRVCGSGGGVRLPHRTPDPASRASVGCPHRNRAGEFAIKPHRRHRQNRARATNFRADRRYLTRADHS